MESRVRLAELLAAISLASDLSMGRPLEQALRVTYLAGQLARRSGLGDEELANVLYVSLLQNVGCAAGAHDLAAYTAADELAVKASLSLIDPDDRGQQVRLILRHMGSAGPILTRPAAVARALTSGAAFIQAQLRGHCEVGAVVAQRLGLGDGVQRGLRDLFERWDGQGPNGVRGDDISLAARVCSVAGRAELFYSAGGEEAAREVVRTAAERILDPKIAASFLELANERPPWAGLTSPGLWSDVLALEPPSRRLSVDERGIDEVALAAADLVDLKSPYTVGHSRGVARIAEEAARRLHLAPSDVVSLRRAALMHDLGRVGIPNTILDKPGPLTLAESERVRLHPYYTERILARTPVLQPLAGIAGAHHERLDGSGYHRGSQAAQLPIAARLLAAADVCYALTEERPYRLARSRPAALEVLRDETRRGRLDADCVAMLVATLDEVPLGRRRALPGLSEREVEVLRLLARGSSNRQIAHELGISEKTAGHHVEHIYDKLGVSTRAAAVLQAVTRGLADDAVTVARHSESGNSETTAAASV